LGLTHEEKNLRSYQSVIILKPDLDGPQLDQAIEKIEQIFQKGGGAVIRLEKWGKKRLAYKIKKHKFGIYLNIYHTCESLKVPEMEKEYQLYDQIIKYLVIRLEDKDLERIMQESESSPEGEEGSEVLVEESPDDTKIAIDNDDEDI
jgi:small subunit ribosomal protein S6